MLPVENTFFIVAADQIYELLISLSSMASNVYNYR